MFSSLDSLYYPAFFHQIHPYYPQLLRILSKETLNWTTIAGKTKAAYAKTVATTKKEFQIDGMHCGSCAIGIRMILSSQDGIKNVSVSYEGKSGEIEYDDKKTNVKGIEK